MKKSTFFTTLALVALSIVVLANVAFAASGYIELAPLPGTQTSNCPNPSGGGGTVPCVGVGGTNTLGAYINTIYKLAVAGASVLAVLMIIIGGFTYVSTDAINNKEEGKGQIKAALGGLLLVLASWVILYTVNPQLTSLKIASKALDSRSLADFFNFGAAASQAYGQILDKLLVNLDAKKETIANIRETSAIMQSQLNDYNALDAALTSGTSMTTGLPLTPEEILEMGLQRDDMLDSINTNYGSVGELQTKMEDLDNKANVIWEVTRATTIYEEAIAEGQASRSGCILASCQQTYEQGIISQTNQLETDYLARLSRINGTTSFTSDQKTQLSRLLNSQYNRAVTSLCNNTTSANNTTCMNNIAPTI